MSIISIPNTFSAGATVIASQHNSNFSTIYSDYNGGITDANINASAAIAYSKLNLTGSLVNADINTSAAIVASKLDLTSPGAIGSTAANTGAFTTLKVGTTNQGDLLYDNSTSIVRLPPGTAGQYLKTQGAAANPVWADNASGLTLISNTTVSAATNSGNIAITTTNYYKVIMHLGNLSAADTIALLVNNDTGGTTYQYALDGRTTGGAVTAGSAGAAQINITTDIVNSSSSYLQAEFLITPSDTSVLLFSGKSTYKANSGTLQAFVDFMGFSNISTPTSFRVITVGGATMSGNILLYKLVTV